MVTRRPLVVQDGYVAELPVGDSIPGDSAAQVIAGSGLVGGGSASGAIRIDAQLAPNPSGLIFVGNSLGVNGAAQTAATQASASGTAAAFIATSALASGNASLVTASTALASGNAALDLVPTLGGGGGGTVAEFTAASAVASGYVVGFDGAGKVQSVAVEVTDNSNPMSFPSAAVVFESARSDYISATYDSTNNRVVIAYQDDGNSDYGTAIVAAPGSNIYPTISSQNNFIGIAQNTVASGTAISVRLPGSYDQNNTGLTTGAVYYVSPTTSGFATTATQPPAWSGGVNWGPIGRAVNSTTLLLTDML